MAEHWLDRSYGLILRRRRYFMEGWGDADAVGVDEDLFEVQAPEPVEPQWCSSMRRRGVIVRDGWFESPCASRLPEEARRAHVRWLLPARGQIRGVVLVMAAWGDEGYGMREPIMWPLVRRGLSAIMFENAFYGSRRPPGQRLAYLRRVSEMAAMAQAVCMEGRGVMGWLRAEGYEAGITGYSMGAQMTILVGGSLPWPVSMVPLIPAVTPATVFTEGLLRVTPDWRALADRQRFRELLLQLSVLRLPPPLAPERTLLVGATHDAIVPARDVHRIAAHWPQTPVRWLPAGHVSAYLWHRPAMRRAIWDGFFGHR